jgi:surface antigen
MKTPAHYFTSKKLHDSDEADDEYDDDPVFGELEAGERIAHSNSGSSRKGLLSSLTIVLLALGGGWTMFGDQLTLQALRPAGTPQSTLDKPPDVARAAYAPTSEAPPAIVAAPEPNAKALETGSLPSAATPYVEAKPEPLGPVKPDPSEPNQVKAVAAGLHPGLSRVLLARMSAADYRNAGIAIKTALARAPSEAVLVWPDKPEPGEAVFEVRFVQSADQSCRRYVVTIAKSGWATTALPMEKCDSRAFQAKRE